MILNKHINNIKGLHKNKVYNIDFITSWLLDTKEKYKLLSDKLRCSCDDPFCRCDKTKFLNEEDITFYNVYYEIQQIVILHEEEQQAKIELRKYAKIKDNKSKLKEWVLNNEDFVCSSLPLFLVKYFDSDSEYLKIAYYHFRVYIDNKYFKNLIQLKKIFDKLYYVDRICPEKEEKINAELEIYQELEEYLYTG